MRGERAWGEGWSLHAWPGCITLPAPSHAHNTALWTPYTCFCCWVVLYKFHHIHKIDQSLDNDWYSHWPMQAEPAPRSHPLLRSQEVGAENSNLLITWLTPMQAEPAPWSHPSPQKSGGGSWKFQPANHMVGSTGKPSHILWGWAKVT